MTVREVSRDVYPPSADFPGGVELNVADSIVRARYRDSLEKAALMQPGQVYRFQIRMYPTSLVFAKGHRIRLDISCSNFPRLNSVIEVISRVETRFDGELANASH